VVERKTGVVAGWAVDILARFLPRSGESRDAGRSVGDSALRGPGIFGCVESVVMRAGVLISAGFSRAVESWVESWLRGMCACFLGQVPRVHNYLKSLDTHRCSLTESLAQI
jgi:hypothetical protein